MADWLPSNNQVTQEIDAKFHTLANVPPLSSTYVPPPPQPVRPAMPQLAEIQAPMSASEAVWQAVAGTAQALLPTQEDPAATEQVWRAAERVSWGGAIVEVRLHLRAGRLGS